MSTFTYEKDSDGIVTITMDMTGPVNAMNEEYRQEMPAILDKLETEDDLTGVIIASAKKTFFAGGDLKELYATAAGEEAEVFERIERIKTFTRRLEKLPVPVVAALNGAALGGGFEICLGCNYRIAWANRSVLVGLPEVSLGLLPGAGGVVRLTNLLGLDKALPYLMEGKKVSAANAEEVGLIDETVATLEELLPRAKAYILENRDNAEAATQPWDRKGFNIPGGNINTPATAEAAVISAYRLMRKTRGNQPAPERILETAVEAVTVDFDTALRIESRKFVSVLATPQAKNMINTFFFGMNEVKGGKNRPKGYDKFTVKKVGVIGAGMMGQGIANVTAMAGIPVTLCDVSIDAAEKGKAYTAKLLDKAQSRGQIDDSRKAGVLNLITATDNPQDLDGCDLIVEAVFEKVDLKNTITKANEGKLSKDGIWGTNTSTLPITRLAEASRTPENFIGLHFFSPVDRMPLVEIICGEKTSDETLAKAFDYVQQIRKVPIVVNDSVGFFTSRVIGNQLYEAAVLLQEGVDPALIENIAEILGMPTGPLALLDELSLRLIVEINQSQIGAGLKKAEDDLRPEGTALFFRLVHEFNRGGRYHGDGGFYDYTDQGKTLWPRLYELFHNPDYEISNEDISDRLLFSNVIDSLRCLEEGVLRSVSDGNIGSVLGIGAPTWTGGYLQFVNTYGLQRFIDRCDELADRYGERFRAPSIVAEKLEAGDVF
jgi:3-hydroxyacyl-CoA dehydrogenase/enoyl-CoA hydratase/3-hydroxybutyryl-CoA epimerase